MFRLVTAPIAAAARESLNRGLTALVWGGVIVGLIVIGAGFLLAAAFLGLSMLLGPFLASDVLGLGLIVLGLLITLIRRPRALVAPQPPVMPRPFPAEPFPPDPLMPPLATPLGQLAFVVGFVAARTLLRRLGRTSGD